MTCDEARDLLLEAEPEALRGTGTSALALHLAGCAECRAMAVRVLAQQAALDRALTAMAEARLAAPARPARRRWRLATWGLAAAAGLAALLLARPDRPDGDGRLAAPPRLASAPAAVDVDVSATPGRNAVVMKTADPTITIVWFF